MERWYKDKFKSDEIHYSNVAPDNNIPDDRPAGGIPFLQKRKWKLWIHLSSMFAPNTVVGLYVRGGVPNAWLQVPLSGGPTLQKFRTTQNLAIGNNIITHNLNLTDFIVNVEVRDSLGQLVAVTVVFGSETANTVTIYTPVPLLKHRITIIG